MGTWGATVATRGRWDPDGFEAQTPQFVTGVENGEVRFAHALVARIGQLERL